MLFLFWIFAEKRGWRGWWKSTAKTTHKNHFFYFCFIEKSTTSHTPSQLHLIANMTADTLTNEFNFIQLDDNNRTTPKKVLEEANPISPESSSDLSISSSNSVCSDIAPSSSFQRAEVKVSEHKLAEIRGDHAEEPLLKENPNRFVLFPIEDNEVSLINGSCDFFFWWHVMQHPSHPTPSLHTHPP